MAEKQFIGKVFEKTFNNGGSLIKLTLSNDDKYLLEATDGDVTIEIKKSLKGKWYAEISQYQGPTKEQEHQEFKRDIANHEPATSNDDDTSLPF